MNRALGDFPFAFADDVPAGERFSVPERLPLRGVRQEASAGDQAQTKDYFFHSFCFNIMLWAGDRLRFGGLKFGFHDFTFTGTRICHRRDIRPVSALGGLPFLVGNPPDFAPETGWEQE